MNKKNIFLIIVMVLIVAAFTIMGVRSFVKSKTTMLQKPKLDNSVVGKKWTWEATLMNNDEHILPKDRDAFTITFNEDGSFNGTTDCNNFFGQYEREGNKLSFGPIAATRMYCEGSQENEFTSTLSEVDSFMLNEKGNLVLLLKLDSGSIIFQDKYSEYNARKWELIKQAVKDCKVKEAGQTHGRKVSVELKNGQRIEAFEPNIDDIFSIINESEEKCGDVNMWTE